MLDFFSQLPSNPVAWLITVLIAIYSLRIAYRSTPQKILKFSISDNELITNKSAILSKLKIIYNGNDVNKLTVTKIFFWNNSFPTIKDTDIVKAAPLAIEAKDGEILDVSVLFGKETSNNINVTLFDNQTAHIKFDYLDRHDGGIIQVVHTGNEGDIDISRKLQGGKIKVITLASEKRQLFSVIIMAFPILFPLIILISIVGLFEKFIPKSWYSIEERKVISGPYAGAFFCIILILMVVSGVLVCFYFNSGINGYIPRKLKRADKNNHK